MAHKEQLSNILSYLDNVEDDDNAPFDNKQTIKERKINTASSTTTTKRFIWDDWDEESLSSSHNQQNQAEDGYNFDDDISAQSPLSTISPESSRRKNNNNNNFISPIIHNDHKTQQTNSSLGHENSTISSSVTAVAFRDVQSKIQAMQSELDQRSEEVLCKEKELHNVRLAAEASRTALINSWKAKNEDAEITAQAALDRQREFQHRLVVDVDKLKNKQEELSEQVSRVIRRREGEIAAAKRNIISNLRSEREAWVSNERGKLARLAESKADSMKASAVESLEPVLTELIRNQRLEMRDLEIKLKDKFGLTIRQHKIRLQKDKDEMTASIESRFNAAMLRQREVWSEEFREAMAKCEEDALKLRQDHDQAMMNDRASHDHMWRQLMANKEAEVEEVRVEASAKASKLVQEHSKYMTELAEKQKTSLRVASKARLLNEENFKKRVLDEIAEDRAKLDAKVLAQVKAKANRELEMVEERLNRQFREELSHLEGEMIEKKSKLTTELDERLKNIKFNHFGNLKSRNNPKKNSNKNDNKNDIDDDGNDDAYKNESIFFKSLINLANFGTFNFKKNFEFYYIKL
mmetsp:Transcript_34356/g.44327  ORF Transcript_34356/g.44327 Transcript_34356/m.44327 type:complete len:579 (-) Transcript_34356:2229-3965(-)